jgi:lipoprotein-releasing system permease protein
LITLLRIAEAQLRGRPRQVLLALVSVAVGSAMLIVTLSLTQGLSEDFINKSLETSPHVEILPRRLGLLAGERLSQGEGVYALGRHHVPDEKRSLRPLAGILSQTRALAGVRLATPAAEAQGVLIYGTVRRPVLVSGVVPQEEAEVTILDERVVAGSWDEFLSHKEGAVLGISLARALGLPLGATVQALGLGGSTLSLRVVGLVQTGLASVDKTLVLVHLEQAQILAGLSADQATKVRVLLQDPWQAKDLARQLEERVGYVCTSWLERSAAQIESFDRQNLITRVLVFFTMLVAGFGVANVLVQLAAQKRRDIAILRASGFSRRAIGQIFLLQGLLLALLGTAWGWLGGALLIRLVAKIPVDFGEQALLRNEHLQMAEYPWFYLLALGLSLFICALASLQPARRAARLQPTEILRGEH